MRNWLHLFVVVVTFLSHSCASSHDVDDVSDGDAGSGADAGTSAEADSDTDGGTEPDVELPSCEACHAIPPSTGKHQKHGIRGCFRCHGDVVDSTNIIVDQDLHDDGKPDIVPDDGVYNPETRICSSMDCHGLAKW